MTSVILALFATVISIIVLFPFYGLANAMFSKEYPPNSETVGKDSAIAAVFGFFMFLFIFVFIF